jgi:hypothetical protein
MNVSPLLTKSIDLTLQEILPKMNARSNFFKFFPNYDVPGEAVSSARGTYATVLLGKSSRRCSRYSSYFFGRVTFKFLNLTQGKRFSTSDFGDIIKRDQAYNGQNRPQHCPIAHMFPLKHLLTLSQL